MNNKYILDSILNSYDTHGVINRFDRYHFPTKHSIEHVLHLLKEMLFPGFFGSYELDNNKLEDITKKRLDLLEVHLTTEIGKTLMWKNHVGKVESQISLIQKEANSITLSFLESFPVLRLTLKSDAQAVFEGDPAAKSINEVILSYPGFEAIMVYRIAHYFYLKDIPLIPRQMSELVHSSTGIDIHPGATIGEQFCIDHGTGIVIGETAVIGNDVKLYQGVTLGAFSVDKNAASSKRHPTIEDGVTIYARSTILGGNTVIGKNSIVGGNVWLTESLPPNTKIYVSADFKASFKQSTKK
ncbi:serine acetyltransferase [Candidatus Marinamargulisbacteria bacterium SCGC AAA071-K20]|nr:serine acetyltransferase [Candidatus Marinamargulisbacteria bacterium SCGC AAA071-K20]